MTSVTAIGVDDEENVVANPTDRGFELLPIRDDRHISPVWELRRCGRRFEAEASFVEGALEEHRQMYAVSAVRLTLAYPSSASPPAAAADWHQRIVKYASDS